MAKRLEKVKRYLAAVKRSDEKERMIAKSSPQAAAQAQEGGPAKLSEFLKVTWNVFFSFDQ